MSDTYTLSYKNFRSLEDVTLEVAPLTVVYGPNGSGKSSLIYGLMTLRNFLTNPTRNMPSLFAYPSISLGGYEEVVHRHLPEKNITIAIESFKSQELSPKFSATLSESGGTLDLSFSGASIESDPRIWNWPRLMRMPIAVPYQSNQRVEEGFSIYPIPSEQEHQNYNFAPAVGMMLWNGTSIGARLNSDVAEYADVVNALNERANLAMEVARQTGFVPLRRGFSKSIFSSHAVPSDLSSEEEVASLLASTSDRFVVEYEVSRYAAKIAGRRIQSHSPMGTSIFTIDSLPTGRGTPTSIVNEGFGINQLVYMLTICLYSRFKIVAIEEPEIHLHPSMVRELAIALAEIAVEKDRRLIVSTHSETFVVALLSQIAAGKINTDDVSFVHAENPNGSTILTQQKATRNGQIEGGLRAFMESEAKDLVDFLGLSAE